MRAVVQRVARCRVTVSGETTGEIGRGLLVLLGVAQDDTDAAADYLAEKIVGLRIFDDAGGKMNRSLLDVGGELLVVSQFTLYGDVRRGRRPSFTRRQIPITPANCTSILSDASAPPAFAARRAPSRPRCRSS